jgi:glycosyltransferase involved in cell wall biosynthesis
MNGLAHEEQRLKGDSIFNRNLAFLIQKTEKIATRSSNCIISVTHQIASYLSHEFYCQKNKVKVVGNGVDTKKFRPIGDPSLLTEWRKKLGIMEGEVVVAFVGNIAPWQGVNILVDSAFRLLLRRGQLKFLIVGDGLLKAGLMKKVLDSGFEKEFIFTGMQRYYDIPFLINLAEICVAPFIFERNRKTGVSPLKVFEYMACGKPVVASRIQGLEFIEAEGAGRLVEPGDVKNLEETLFDLFKDNQKRINMGRKGLQIAREKFTWDSRVINIEKILMGLA